MQFSLQRIYVFAASWRTQALIQRRSSAYFAANDVWLRCRISSGCARQYELPPPNLLLFSLFSPPRRWKRNLLVTHPADLGLYCTCGDKSPCGINFRSKTHNSSFLCPIHPSINTSPDPVRQPHCWTLEPNVAPSQRPTVAHPLQVARSS